MTASTRVSRSSSVRSGSALSLSRTPRGTTIPSFPPGASQRMQRSTNRYSGGAPSVESSCVGLRRLFESGRQTCPRSNCASTSGSFSGVIRCSVVAPNGGFVRIIVGLPRERGWKPLGSSESRCRLSPRTSPARPSAARIMFIRATLTSFGDWSIPNKRRCRARTASRFARELRSLRLIACVMSRIAVMRKPPEPIAGSRITSCSPGATMRVRSWTINLGVKYWPRSPLRCAPT